MLTKLKTWIAECRKEWAAMPKIGEAISDYLAQLAVSLIEYPSREAAIIGELDKALCNELLKWPLCEKEAVFLINFFGRAAAQGIDPGTFLQEMLTPHLKQSLLGSLPGDLSNLLDKHQSEMVGTKMNMDESIKAIRAVLVDLLPRTEWRLGRLPRIQSDGETLDREHIELQGFGRALNISVSEEFVRRQGPDFVAGMIYQAWLGDNE